MKNNREIINYYAPGGALLKLLGKIASNSKKGIINYERKLSGENVRLSKLALNEYTPKLLESLNKIASGRGSEAQKAYRSKVATNMHNIKTERLLKELNKAKRNRALAIGVPLLGVGSLGGFAYTNSNKGYTPELKKTIDEIEAKYHVKLPEGAVDRNGNPTDACAAYMNGVLLLNGIAQWGNAYQAVDESANGTVLNGYNGVEEPDTLGMRDTQFANSEEAKEDAQAKLVLEMHKLAAKNFADKIDTTQMDRTHLYPVNFWHKNSPHTTEFYMKAKRNGNTTYGSHTGVVFNDHGTWMVTDNVGSNGEGHKRVFPLSEVIGYSPFKSDMITAMGDAGLVGGNNGNFLTNLFK